MAKESLGKACPSRLEEREGETDEVNGMAEEVDEAEVREGNDGGSAEKRCVTESVEEVEGVEANGGGWWKDGRGSEGGAV